MPGCGRTRSAPSRRTSCRSCPRPNRGASTSVTQGRRTPPRARCSTRSSSRTCSPRPPAASRLRSRRSPRPRRGSRRSSTSGARRVWWAAADMPDVVEVRELRKRFDGGGRGGPVYAIDGVDLATEPGEYLVLLGPSGCGKTTLLRTIAGLEEPTSGEVLIGGHVVNGLPPRARKIAMVFQSYALYPHKTVLSNITFPLRAERLPADQQRERVQ